VVSEDFAMSTGPNRIMDEFAKLVTDAAGAAQGVRREVETAFRAQAERILNSMDVVQREEFEAAREMAIKAREENVRLSARIDALEAKLAGLAEAPGSTAPAAAAKPRPKNIP
jgi:BMFP domain-containing protein YqiC